MTVFKQILVLILLVALGGCAGSHYSGSGKIERALALQEQPVSEYRIGPSDQLRISVWRNDDLSAQVPVRPDGRISLPLIGDINARGRTPEGLARAVEERLEEYIRQPKVSVIVNNMGSHEFSHRVRVTGAVNGPASQPWREGITVLDITLGAGGVNDFAAPNRATLYRELEGEMVAIPVKLGDILDKGDIATNYRLLPGDILSVPERRF